MDWSISLAFRNKLFIVFSRKWAICDSLMNTCSWLYSHMLFLDGRHVLTWCSHESLLWCGITCAPMTAILLTLAWLINFKYSIFDHHSSRKNSPSLSHMGERNYTQGTRYWLTHKNGRIANLTRSSIMPVSCLLLVKYRWEICRIFPTINFTFHWY